MSVQFETQEHVALITLDRPEARNAINGVMATGIESALDRYESDDSLWAAILTANGPVFCAGADLKEIAAGNAGATATAKGGFGGIVQRVRSKPLIAALQGPALAGGCEIALACDMIVSSNEAFFSLPEVKRALIAVAGGLFRLPRAIGMAQAMEVILTGEPLSAERAYQLGLVNRLAPPTEVRDTALALARQIASNAPLAVQASRNLAARAFAADDTTLWREGFEAFQQNMQTEDAKEGPRAFIEKRAPRWKAR
ncbi:MAG: enoyl-CoA hydratase-related protein [Myxococcales bacterium]|jgi:enoyl-CoA hydratase